MAQSGQSSRAGKQESYWALMIASLRYRNFRLVWLGSITEHFGEYMQVAGILWLANELTHSPLMLTIVGSARFMPMIVFPLVGGVVADRVNRRSMLIVALLGSVLLASLLAVLTATGRIAVWHLIVVSLLIGITQSFNHPARHTIVPNLVEKGHLLNAIALDSISVQASRILSMPIAGYLIVAFGVWPIFLIAALGCLLAIVWLLMAKVPATPPATRKQAPWQNLTEGFRYLRANLIILALMLLYLIPWLANNTYTNFLPVFANDILNIGAVGYGYLQAAPGLGALASLLGLTMLTYHKRKTLLLLAAGMTMGLALIAFSASQWVLASLALLVVIGAMQNAFNTLNTTTIQSAVPDHVRGRVISWREVAFGLGPTGSIIFGAIAQSTGVPFSVAILGTVCLLVSLSLAAFIPRLRSIG